MTNKSKHNMTPVYVLDINGCPIMPTFRYKHIRQLKKKRLVKVVSFDPFTVQMLYDVGVETQEITLGIDTGTSHIGASATICDGKELLSSIFNTNTLKIKKGMEDRAAQRHTRARFKREKKKRRALKNGTTFSGIREFTVSGAELPTICKIIKSTPCRLDKTVNNGKLSNTAKHCLDNHVNVVNKIAKILPIKRVNVEYAMFDTHKLTNPLVYGKGYQNGALKNELNHKAYALNRDGHRCVLCSKSSPNDKLEVHHVKYRSNGGLDHFNNFITLHDTCHEKVHKNKKIEEKLHQIIKKKDILKDFVETRPSTILNTVMIRFYDYLLNNFDEVNKTFGHETKAKRFLHGIEKTHNNDAYLVALGDEKPNKKRVLTTEYNQFSRNDRVYIYATKQRRYSEKVNGKWKGICYNRNKGEAQPTDSLAEYRKEKGEKAVSKLKVTKGMRTFVDRSNYQFYKGDLVSLKGKFFVVKGNTNSGLYVRLEGQGNVNFKPKDLRLVEKSKGFRRINW